MQKSLLRFDDDLDGFPCLGDQLESLLGVGEPEPVSDHVTDDHLLRTQPLNRLHDVLLAPRVCGCDRYLFFPEFGERDRDHRAWHRRGEEEHRSASVNTLESMLY